MTGNALLDLLLLALPAGLIGLWWTGSRVRELAVGHARRACENHQVQFLDQSVALSRFRLDRTGGASAFRRDYAFEFTDRGEHRDGGTVTMRGQRLVRIHFPWVRDEDGNRVWIQ